MTERALLSPDRLFPSDPNTRCIARRLYDSIFKLPIISPHGHTDASWFAHNQPFENPLELLVTPDHYVLRLLYSQGLSLQSFGVSPLEERVDIDPRAGWQTFAENFYLFRGTPTQLWFNHVFEQVFGIKVRLSGKTADLYFDEISQALSTDAFRPRALFERFNIRFLATTECATDTLRDHQAIRDAGWSGRVVTTYRPDKLTNPDHPEFQTALQRISEQTGSDAFTWRGYLEAHRVRRRVFAEHGATATDHGHPTARTADLPETERSSLFERIISGEFSVEEAELFRAQMLTEMARMSQDDGLVMQIHPGVYRNHNSYLFDQYGPDIGGDIPTTTNYVDALRPLLNAFGNNPDFSLIVFTVDETAYARELAPLAGHYPALKLGPAWWFHDSPQGMMRFREQTTEVAGFYNTVGFNDDTRAFFSIPARHDMARRVDCAWLARLVAEHRISMQDASNVAKDLTVQIPAHAYRIDEQRS